MRQKVQFEKSWIEIVVALKRCIFDPALVKPKCVQEAVVYSEKSKINFQKRSKQTRYGFNNIGSKISTTAISLLLFTNRTLCTYTYNARVNLEDIIF